MSRKTKGSEKAESDKKPKRWAVYAKVVGSKFVGEYEAETKVEALAKAERAAHVSLCRACVDECENAEIDELTAEEVDDS